MSSENELTIPERAAAAAHGWYERQRERGERLDPASTLLYQQLAEIYSAPRVQSIDVPYSEVPTWTPRTMTDARVGDVIRPRGADAGVEVRARYLPPRQDGKNARNWHMVSGGAQHWDDHVVRPGELWLQLGELPPRNFKPDFPIDILLTIAEMNAIEALGGWANRLDAGTGIS